WFGGKRLHEDAGLVPSQPRGGLGLSLAVLGGWPGEETPAFPGCRPLPNELEEDAPTSSAPRAVFGQHAPVRLTGECISKDGRGPVGAQRPQHLREQRAVRFLEGLSQCVNSHCIHTLLSLTYFFSGLPTVNFRTAPARPLVGLLFTSCSITPISSSTTSRKYLMSGRPVPAKRK